MVSASQSHGIRLSRELGLELARAHPEMAKERRGLRTLDSLAKKYVPLEYQASESIRINAIHNALVELIVSDEEREDIARRSIEKRRMKIYRAGLGKIKHEDLVEQGRNALTPEQRVEAGKKLAQLRGVALYDSKLCVTPLGVMHEKEYILKLKESGFSWRYISEKVNETFGNNRTARSLCTMYNNRWK